MAKKIEVEAEVRQFENFQKQFDEYGLNDLETLEPRVKASVVPGDPLGMYD